jgi:hypothetical protein
LVNVFQREEYVGLGALWLQEEAASQMHCFRDAEPQPVIPHDPKKNHGMQLRPGIHISLTTTDP